jgi:hypothetical protein
LVKKSPFLGVEFLVVALVRWTAEALVHVRARLNGDVGVDAGAKVVNDPGAVGGASAPCGGRALQAINGEQSN